MTSDHVQQRIVLLLTDVHDAARSGDWTTVKEKTEQVLHLNPFNHDARAYWSLARNGGISPEEPLASRVADLLDNVKIAIAAQDWQEAIDQAEKVIELDPSNTEAKGYIRSAQEALAAQAKKGRSRNAAGAPDRAVRGAATKEEGRYLFADSNFLSKALSGVIAVVSLLAVLAAAFYYYGAGLVEKVGRGEAAPSKADQFDDIATLLARLLVAGFVAGFVLLLIWVYRESTNARAMGLRTLTAPSVSVLVCVAVGTLGTYVVLRDLLHRLRGSLSLAGEALLAVWLIAAIGGLAMSFQSIKHPADYEEWADLLRLACYGSALLGVAGLCLAYAVRQGHQDLMDRYLRPNRAPRIERADSVAA
jgi:hypothetical protein